MEAAMNNSIQYQENTTRDLLTGLLLPRGFMESARQFIPQLAPDSFCLLSVDVMHFRLFNKFHGREMGNRFLRHIAECLDAVQKQHGGVTGYFEADHFCIVMPWQMELVKQLWDQVQTGVTQMGRAMGVTPVFGISPIDDPELPPEIFYDRATLARSRATARNQISCYDPEMENYLEEEMRLLMEVTEALDRGEFTFFAQPQCDIFTGKVVGAESLVRWRHSTKGLIPPGKFIPVLERSGMIHLLDRQVWEKVCQWLRSWVDRGYQPVPISINISRIDIMAMDVPTYLMNLLEKYDLPAKYIKAEITESAYAEEDNTINSTVDRLREAGFLVMMDDFGSGYSSLNMLKSVAVDVIKIDMRFLDIRENEEHKGIGILESIANMARFMGLPIIVEGVETLQQENILRDIGCRYTQGYYYYKPLPIEQFEETLADERRLDFGGLRCRQVESFHIREFLDGNLFTDAMLNNILGPSAIYDLFENNFKIIRLNEQYYRMAGMEVTDNKDLARRIWSSVREDDRPALLSLFEQAHERRPAGAEGNIHYLRVDGKVLWLRVRVFFLREKEGHRMYFVTMSDITSLREWREERARLQQCEECEAELSKLDHSHLDQYYGGLPFGFGLARIVLGPEGEPTDYNLVYVNHEMEQMCGSADMSRLNHLILKAFGDNRKDMLNKAYQAAFLGERINHFTYSSISNHYLQFTLYQYESGYAACLLRDVTDLRIYEGSLNSLVLAYREIYYLQLQENYCRKIYPSENSLMDRGNYEAMVDRHFGTGKILKYDEDKVRRFLSLDNLRLALKTQDSVEYRYRRRGKDVEEEWCLVTVTISARENGQPQTAVITIQNVDNIVKEETERMVEALATMSYGFFIYHEVGDERILYANPAMAEMFGCQSIAELMELVGHSFRGVVHPEDLDRVEWEIKNQIDSSEENMDHVKYRIIRKDGEIRWIDDWGHLETSKWGKEQGLFYVFIKDITDSITSVEKKKLLNANRFYRNGEPLPRDGEDGDSPAN